MCSRPVSTEAIVRAFVVLLLYRVASVGNGVTLVTIDVVDSRLLGGASHPESCQIWVCVAPTRPELGRPPQMHARPSAPIQHAYIGHVARQDYADAVVRSVTHMCAHREHAEVGYGAPTWHSFLNANTLLRYLRLLCLI